MHSTLLYVETEDVSSISVLKDKASRPKNVQLEVVKFLKKKSSAPHALFHTPPFSISHVCCKLSKLDALMLPGFSR
jgi:hypothetical protein